MIVEVTAEGAERPPVGAPLVVQVLDVTYADAPAQVLNETKTRVADVGSGPLQVVEIPFEPVGAADYRVRAHVDVDGDDAVSPGDFVTTAAYPARTDAPVRVVVKKI